MMVTFLASIAPLQTGITIGQDGMRIKLDIPETEMGNAVELLAMRGIVVRVTIEPENQAVTGNAKDGNKLAARPKRKSRWTPAEIAGDDGDTGEGR